jgi:DNA-binding NarL/FixJ family response regulator
VVVEAKMRILIADDHAEVLAAVRDVILEFPGVEVVATTTNVEEAVRESERFHPDIAFVDAWLEGGGAATAAARIKSVSPETSVIALASAKELETVLRLHAAGATACYDKEQLSEVLPGILAATRRS